MYTEDQLKKALAEQHKNTRHDAIEKMQEIRNRWGEKYNFSMCDSMLDEITGAIMNLKQRTPET
jgi:ferritin-like metal-binding protein YciE